MRVASDIVAIDKRPRSLVHTFLQRVEETPDEDAFYYPVEGGWQESTWVQTHDLVEGLAGGLVALGVEPGDRVAIVATSRFEWVLAFLAAQWSGAAVTPIEPGVADDVLASVIADSGARVVVAEDFDTVRALWRIRGRIREVTKVVQIDGEYPDPRVLSLEGLLELGQEHLAEQPRALAQRLYAVRRQGLAALVYPRRRGPADAPRGVRLTHASLTYQGSAVASLGVVDDGDLLLLGTPLSGTFGQAVLSVQLACGFPLALVGRPDALVDSLAVVRPTVFAATPGVLERIRAEVEQAQRSGLLRRRAADRAFAVARQVREHEAEGEKVPGRLARRHRSLDKRVLADVRDVFGDRLRFVACAGSGLRGDLADFFELADVAVLETYGRPEAAGAVTVALPEDRGSGTAGRPLPGTEVRVSDDGEVLVAGPGVMEGYHRHLADTRAALDHGWLHTGDAGVLDPAGRLRVLGCLATRRGPDQGPNVPDQE